MKEEINTSKRNQSELLVLKSSLKKFQTTIKSFINRLEQAEERISEPEVWSFKQTWSDKKKKIFFNNKVFEKMGLYKVTKLMN